MKKETGVIFIFLALLSLLGGMFFGSISALQFVFPDFFSYVPFYKMRPLHVSLVVAWLFLASIGGIYYYLPKFSNVKLFSDKLSKIHFWFFFLTGILIIACYFAGKFGGREYWEFPALLSIPIFISWILFGWNYFKSVAAKAGQWPVYFWMWGTGILFFFITFAESYLWVLPYFRDNLIRDLTVQWKAYGALTGAWNMLVYGTGIFVMEKIKDDEKIAHTRLSFLMYFLGLINLLFGWAHHIYIVPTAPWVRIFAYGISMTELLILGKIIWTWRKSLQEAKKKFYVIPYKFLAASDFWIFINLILALAISVPAVNVFTHGTHITVAHAMGGTIGIDSMILLASCFFLISHTAGNQFSSLQLRTIKAGFWLSNFSLLVFWISLIAAGAEKGKLIVEGTQSFQQIMQHIHPFLTVFAFAGIGIFIGLLFVILPALNVLICYLKSRNDKT